MFERAADQRLWVQRDLRTRYAPKSQVGRGLIQSAPWVNLAILLIFFHFVPLQHVIQPGVGIDLPVAPLQEGSPYGPTAVVMSHGGQEIIFFNDQRYALEVQQQRRALSSALRELASRNRDVTLTLEADTDVRHGTMVDIYNTALEAGIGKVHVATRVESAVPPRNAR